MEEGINGMNKYSCVSEWGENMEGEMALKFYIICTVYISLFLLILLLIT